VQYECILGLDPGASGAIAFYFPNQGSRIAVFDMPLVDGDINCSHLAGMIKDYAPNIAIIEMVGARPGQGVSSMFKFGMAFGMARGVIASLMIPQRYVSPAKWKKHFGLAADKEKARELAIQFWPSSSSFARKKDHGRAEAALLCKYGAEALKF
jgi:crossover junction endodeoxyribonuclease RuvC